MIYPDLWLRAPAAGQFLAEGEAGRRQSAALTNHRSEIWG